MSEQLEEIYEIINGVLNRIKQPKLGENQMLKSENLDFEIYQRYWSLREEGKLFFMIEVDESGVSFFIDRTSEIPYYSYQQIMENQDEFKRVLETLFTKPSRIKYKGNKTTVEFLDSKIIFSFRFYSGLRFNFFQKEKIFDYPPYFTVSNKTNIN